MTQEIKLKNMANYYNDCYRLAIDYDKSQIADILGLPSRIISGWDESSYIKAQRLCTQIIRDVEYKLSNNNLEFNDWKEVFKAKIFMIQKGINKTLESEFHILSTNDGLFIK